MFLNLYRVQTSLFIHKITLECKTRKDTLKIDIAFNTRKRCFIESVFLGSPLWLS